MREEKRLSDRQMSIVRLVAEGHTNKQIGRILNMSLKTVETHRALAVALRYSYYGRSIAPSMLTATATVIFASGTGNG